MVSKKKFANLGALSIFLITSACGGYPQTAPMPQIYQTTVAQTVDEEDCCCEDDTNTNNTSSNTSSDTSTTKEDTSKTDTKTDTKDNTTTGTKNDKTEEKDDVAATKGRKALDKVMEYISKAKTLKSEVDKYEESISDPNKTTQQSLIIYSRTSPQKQVKLEIIKHSKSSNVGAKVVYTTGSGKATIRPGGALSFITKEFDQTDKNITSPNDYTPESCDYFSMVKRLSNQDYSAEITGKSTLEGKEVYLIKIVKKKGVNELDNRIDHEVIGFDAKTYEVKLWEAYTKGASKPYMKMNIKSLERDLTLTDSIFKV